MSEAGGKQPTQRGVHCLRSLHGHLPKQNIHRWDTALCKCCGCRCWGKHCCSSCWAAGWASVGLSETKKGGRRTISCSTSLLAKTILNALRYALGIFSGKAIYNFGTRSVCGAPAFHFHGKGFCSNKSVMLRKLMPRVERLCSIALVAGAGCPERQKDQGGVEAEHKAVIAAHPLLQGVGNGF